MTRDGEEVAVKVQYRDLPEEEKKEIRKAVMKFHDATGLGTSLQVRDGELLH